MSTARLRLPVKTPEKISPRHPAKWKYDEDMADMAQIMGANLAHARTRAGYSASKLARMIGVTAMTIGAWEDGRTLIPAVRVYQMARLLGRDYTYFFKGLDG